MIAQDNEIRNAQHEVRRLVAERAQSKLDVCYLIRGLGYAAVPKRDRRKLVAYFDRTPLSNCQRYARAK